MHAFSPSVVVVVVVTVGCQPGRAPVRACETTPGETVSADTFQSEAVALETRLEILLGDEVGGPLRCIPGEGVCAPCEGDSFDVVVGDNITVAVDVDNGLSGRFAQVTFQVELTADSDPAFQLLEPVPASTSSEDGPVAIIVSIAPVDVGAIDAVLSITSSASNTRGRPPTLVGLHANAVAP